MRTEKEMFHIIINTAKSDERILAAYLKGSRANPNVPRDIYQDYDIMYVVTETESFRRDLSWIDTFGKVILKQEQNDDFGYGERFGLRSCYDNTYSWLLLFEDGNRIDIGVETVETMQNGTNRNKLFLPLLDKAGYVKRPSAAKFRGCCNEFYWSLCDVVKGILRDEFPFAMSVYYMQTHQMLEIMLEWYIGSETSYSVSCGKMNKYFKRYLSEDVYQLYLQTFPDSNYEHFKQSIENSCKLFHETGMMTAENLGLIYPIEYEDGFIKYVEIFGSSIAKKIINQKPGGEINDEKSTCNWRNRICKQIYCRVLFF